MPQWLSRSMVRLPTGRHSFSDDKMRAMTITLCDMERAPAAPTLEQLRRGTPWCWVVCNQCMHRAPVGGRGEASLAREAVIVPEEQGPSSQQIRRLMRVLRMRPRSQAGQPLARPPAAGQNH